MKVAGAIVVVIGLIASCGDPTPPHIHDFGPFIIQVMSFSPGPGAGFGQDHMPDVVFGPPVGGKTTSQGGTDVVSLGQGGTIVVKMGRKIVNGDGPDLIIFENPFDAPGGAVFSEPGEVSVSADNKTFTAFPCDPTKPAPNGCAGYGVVLARPDAGIDATDPATAGGDAFDLDTIGVSEAQFVKIVDKGTGGPGPSAGFDLDAAAVATHD